MPIEYIKVTICASSSFATVTSLLVKHEIFLGDVTACFSSLKKVVQDIHAMSAAAASLQMGQPTVRHVERSTATARR